MNSIVFAIRWVADRVEQLTTSITVPVALVLAVLAPTALRVTCIVVGIAWVVAKRLPG